MFPVGSQAAPLPVGMIVAAHPAIRALPHPLNCTWNKIRFRKCFHDPFCWAQITIERCLNVQRLKVRYLLCALVLAGILPLSGQSGALPNCLPNGEFEPLIIHNFGNKVSFNCMQATPFDLIKAVGYQTRLPIGVVVGADADVLFKPLENCHLAEVDASAALAEAVKKTGFSVTVVDGVFLLTASDLTPHQQSLLDHHFSNFEIPPKETMVFQGAMLTGWIRNVVNPAMGWGGSILGSTNDEKLTPRSVPNATTKDIAGQIVSQGSRGMWVFKAGPLPSSDLSTIEVEIWPYQHFTNMPMHTP